MAIEVACSHRPASYFSQVTHFLGYPEEHGGEMCWSYAQGMIYCGFRPCHSVLIG